MPATETTDKKARQALWNAQVTTAVHGLAMLVWGLAPAVVHRLASGYTPPLSSFAVGGLTMTVGVALLGLSILISRRVAWALWTVLALASTLLLGSFVLIMVGGAGIPSIFPLLLAACTAGTCWIAIDTRRTCARPQPPAGAA